RCEPVAHTAYPRVVSTTMRVATRAALAARLRSPTAGGGLVARADGEAIAYPPDRFDRLAQRTQLLAQAQDGVVDRAVAFDRGLAPDRVVQVGSAERPPPVAEQEVQETELRAGEVQRRAVQPGEARVRIELEGPELQGDAGLAAVRGEHLR